MAVASNGCCQQWLLPAMAVVIFPYPSEHPILDQKVKKGLVF